MTPTPTRPSRFTEIASTACIGLALALTPVVAGVQVAHARRDEPLPSTFAPIATASEQAEGREAVFDALDRALWAEIPYDRKLRDKLGAELVRVCKRESNCLPVGWHEGDSYASERFWQGAVRRGWLDPEACPDEHAWADDGRWSTAGPWGISMAYLMRYAGEPEGDDGRGTQCFEPFDLADLDRMATAVVRYTAGLHRGGYRSCADRTRVWVGVGRWQSMPLARRVVSVRRQCGEQEAASYFVEHVGT
jgi:hypothetical protein